MAHRSQCSSAGDNPLDPNYLPPHYREEYRMAIDALVDGDLEGYYRFVQEANVVDFLSHPEMEYIKCMVRAPHRTTQNERRYMAEDVDGSSDTYWPVHSDLDAPNLDLGWPQQLRLVGPTEVTTLVNPPDPEMPSIKEQVRRMIKNAQQVVAVVMDMFTDVDIFADVLNAAMRGVAVYILLDELNAHHFVSMANNCRVNLDEMKFMRVRTVCGSTYFCHTGKSFKGQMMDRFILVDCRAVLTGNYSFMWSFEKIHRCLAHLFLGQLVTTFDEEFRILYAHSEPLVVEKVLSNMPHYSNVHGSYPNIDKTHMFKKDYPAMLPEWADHSAEDHMNVGHQMLPYRTIEPYATEENPSIQRHMNLHATQQFRGDRPFIEHGRQMRGPVEMTSFKKQGYPDVPDYACMPPQNQPTIRGKQFMEGFVPKGSQFAREPSFYQGAGLQPDYDMYGRLRSQEIHRSRESLDQFPGAGYPHEINEAEAPGAYDHVQRFLQSQSAVEEGHGARNLLTPPQSNLKRQSLGQSYACQTSPTQPNLPDQKRFFNVNRKSQDVVQKQGMRDWRISSYLSAFDDGGEMDFSEFEGTDLCDNVPCFVQEGPCGPIAAEMRPANIEFNRMPSSRNNPPFIQIQNSSPPLFSSVDHPPDLSENIKITPTTTSESSCTTEGDRVEETQIKKPKETLFGEEFLRSKQTRAVPRSSRLRHSLIFSSNLELNTSEDSGEKDEDEASKLSARVSQMLDKRRAGTREPFQWSSFLRSATVDDQAMESAHSEDLLNKIGVDSDVKVENSQGPLQEKKLPETTQSTVLEEKSKRDDSNVMSSSFMDMNDPDCRLRFFKELAAKRKAEITAGKTPQSNPEKDSKKSHEPEKPSTGDVEKKSSLKTPEVQDNKREESSENILHRATDAEKIRFKKKLAGESLITFQKDTASASNPAVETSKESKLCTQKPLCTLSGKSLQPDTSSPSKPCSRNTESSSAPPLCKTSSLQNQVDSARLITASTTVTQYHIPPSPPVNSSQTKCLPPLKITPNDSGNDFQTPPHQISCTTSNIVPLDSSSKQNLATVDTHLKSKLTPVNTSPTVSTAEPTVSQHITLHTATGEDFSQKSPQQPITKDSSQHPNATELDSSQQLTTAEGVNLGATEQDLSKKPTVMTAELSQQLPVTEVPTQMDSATGANPFQQPAAGQSTATGIDSSLQLSATQNKQTPKPAASEAESFQHPPATQNEQTQKPAATEAESLQHPPATQNEQTQKPAATEAESLQTPAATQNEQTQKPAATEAESLQTPAATQNEQTQKPAATEAPAATQNEQTQKPATTKTESLQHPPAKPNEQTQKPAASETESFQHPPATQNEQTLKPAASEAESFQHPPATQNEQTQKPATTKTESLQHLPAKPNEQTQKPAATEAESLQHPPAKPNEQTQKPAATEAPAATQNEQTQKPATTKTESLQHPPAKPNEQTQKPTETQSEQTQNPAATEAESLQHPPATQNEQTQKPAATEAESLQHPPATQNEQTQKPAATEAESLQHPPATQNEQTQKPAATEAESLQTSVVAEAEPLQNPTATEVESLQHLPATQNEPTQKPAATKTEPLQTPSPTETNSSQQLTAAESELVQKSSSDQADGFQQSIVFGADSTQTFTSPEADDSQQATAAESQSSELPTALKEVSSQPTTTGHEPSQKLTDSLKQPSESGEESQNPPETGTDSSPQSPTPVRLNSPKHAIATECESLQHPTETTSVSASHTSLKVTLSPQTISFSDTDSHLLFQAGSADTSTAKSNSDLNILIPAVCTVQNSDVNTEKKDDKLCQDISKQESIPTALEDTSLSQSIIITDVSSSAEHSQSETLTHCDSNNKSDISKPCPQTDDSKMEQTHTKPSIAPVVHSPDPCLSRPQGSNTSSVQESSCLNDPKHKDEHQKHEDIKKHEPERLIDEVTTDLHPVQVDGTKQTTLEVENSVTNLLEVSEIPESTLPQPTTEHAKSQSTVAENPKQVISAHQSSTVNALSCSNLRDDTKVLLEQISAKNQSRSSQSQQTPATAGEEKESGLKSAGQQLSGHSGRPWSTTASPEEKEMLLQKMEKMRKERKVYSRFEAS